MGNHPACSGCVRERGMEPEITAIPPPNKKKVSQCLENSYLLGSYN